MPTHKPHRRPATAAPRDVPPTPPRRPVGLWAALTALAGLGLTVGCGSSVKPVPERTFTNSVGMEMVCLSVGYYVSRYETTQEQYEQVMGTNPMTPVCPRCPVGKVTGDEALEFCARLTALERERGTLPAGFVYHLPTYAQYLQYVADAPLAGSVTPAGGRGGTHLAGPLPVGSGEVNRLGLYDLRGSVSEWLCERYSTGSLTMVGAFWNEHREDFLTVRNRAGFMNKDEKGPNTGFRCVLVPEK